MTPGFAKPRHELPWLPYPEKDRVIINAHNFPSLGFDPSVNGNTPIAVWCPSRDDAGNGTTTLTDLVGSNHGTLTNMDAATDWVADTDAGGVRALDFDGTNDRVVLASTALLGMTYSISVWLRLAAYGQVAVGGDTVFSYGLLIDGTSLFHREKDGTFSSVAHGGFPLNTWCHVLLSRSGGTVTAYKNGVSVGAMPATFNANFESVVLGSRSDAAVFFSGRLDDVRFFTDALDVSDAVHLATSRGISA